MNATKNGSIPKKTSFLLIFSLNYKNSATYINR